MNQPDEYRAMLATLVCRIPTDDPEFTLTDMMTRWGLQNLTTGLPLTEGDGPTFIDVPPNGWRTEHRRYVMPGTAGASAALWLTDDLDECIAKVRTFRGILHIGRNLTYDLTRWPHLSDHHPRGGTCRRCGLRRWFRTCCRSRPRRRFRMCRRWSGSRRRCGLGCRFGTRHGCGLSRWFRTCRRRSSAPTCGALRTAWARCPGCATWR